METEAVATTPIGRCDITTTFMGAYPFVVIANSLQRASDTMRVVGKKGNACLTEQDAKSMAILAMRLENAADDMLFANDGRAIQLGSDDMVIALLNQEELKRNMAQTYNLRKFEFIMREIGMATSFIGFFHKKLQNYIAAGGKDPFKLTRKWYNRILKRFRLICPQCRFEIKDYELIENYVPRVECSHCVLVFDTEEEHRKHMESQK